MVLLAGYNGGQSAVEANDESVVDVDDLVARLQANGATVTTVENVSQPFFIPEGQIIAVNGQDVQVKG